MGSLNKAVFVAAGYNTTFFGPGRPEFNPKGPMPPFENYLKETAEGTRKQLPKFVIDEGILGSFMPQKFLNQANLPGFLPFMIPELQGKPCTGIEGACGTGGRALAAGLRSILSSLSQVTFVSGFEIQNTMKSIYGADALAGASYFKGFRKRGHAFFFPGIFSDRAGAYFEKYGKDLSRKAMAKWYEQSILNARKNPKAQEFHNQAENLFELALTPPDPEKFLPHLNLYDCSKISDGASSLILLSKEGLLQTEIPLSEVVEIVGMGEAVSDITKPPSDLTRLATTEIAVKKALAQAGIMLDEIGVLEIHDCFSITALLALETIGYAKPGKAPEFILEGSTQTSGLIPTNPSGGLGGFGHPTGATGVRQMVDLLHQLTKKAENQVELKKPYGMMISMGGNDVTVTVLIVKPANL